MKLCEWCEQPTAGPEHELCAKCADARDKVAAGKMIPEPLPKKQEVTIPQILLNGTVMLVKVAVAAVLALVGVVAALFGTCAAIATAGSLFNPAGMLFYLVFAAMGFGVTYLLFKLIAMMFEAKPTLAKPSSTLLECFDAPRSEPPRLVDSSPENAGDSPTQSNDSSNLDDSPDKPEETKQ